MTGLVRGIHRAGRSATVVSALLLTALVGLVGATASPSVAAPASGHRYLKVVVDLTSTTPGHHLSTVAAPRGGTLRYGAAHISGTSTLDGNPVTVDANSTISYLDGTGPFDGALTLTTSAGALGFAYVGEGRQHSDGSSTVRGSLRLISASGSFDGLTGVGSVRGVRAANVPLGGAVTYTITVDLRPGRPFPMERKPVIPGVRNANLVVNSQLAAADSFLVNGPPSRVWGNVQRTGTATLIGTPVDVDLTASLRYQVGSGPLSGFITFTATDLSSVVVSYRGWTTANTDGSSDVRARVNVIAATGAWSGLRGTGIYVAHRPGGVGTSLDLTMSLRTR